MNALMMYLIITSALTIVLSLAILINRQATGSNTNSSKTRGIIIYHLFFGIVYLLAYTREWQWV
jgi:hypothetical protein